MGGEHFSISCNLSKNGYGINSSALIDTGANGFAFIDSAFAVEAAKFLNVEPIRLDKNIDVRGYNGHVGTPVTHVL